MKEKEKEMELKEKKELKQGTGEGTRPGPRALPGPRAVNDRGHQRGDQGEKGEHPEPVAGDLPLRRLAGEL